MNHTADAVMTIANAHNSHETEPRYVARVLRTTHSHWIAISTAIASVGMALFFAGYPRGWGIAIVMGAGLCLGAGMGYRGSQTFPNVPAKTLVVTACDIGWRIGLIWLALAGCVEYGSAAFYSAPKVSQTTAHYPVVFLPILCIVVAGFCVGHVGRVAMRGMLKEIRFGDAVAAIGSLVTAIGVIYTISTGGGDRLPKYADTRKAIKELTHLTLYVGKELRSVDGGTATEIEFVNELTEAVALYWIDTTAKEVRLISLNPKETYVVKTFAQYAWSVKAVSDDRLLGVVVGNRAKKRFKIKD